MSLQGKGSTFGTGSTGELGRADDDFYATSAKTTKLFLDRFKLEGSILEPACGQGHMSEVIKEYYPYNNVMSTDLVYRGYGIGNVDFLTRDFNRRFDTIITNPPFKYAKEFVEKGLEMSNKYVIMLLKIQFLESKSRKELLTNSPLKYIYIHTDRQSTLKDGLLLNPINNRPWSTTLLLAWFVWEIGYKGEPMVRFI